MTDLSRCRVAIVDHHPIVRYGLRERLAKTDDVEVVGAVGSLGEADTLLLERGEEIDVVILDLSLPDGNGLSLVGEIVERGLSIGVLVFTRLAEELYGDRALQVGARGFLEKRAEPSEIVQAIREVAEGHFVVSDTLKKAILSRVAEGDVSKGHPVSRLSDRELEVLEFIGRGDSTREIAEILDISPTTVQTYRERIKKKLDLDSSAALVRYATNFVEGRVFGFDRSSE